MSDAGRSLAVISLTAAALGLGATLALAPSPHAAVLHHTVAAADAVAWGPALPAAGAQAAVLLGISVKEGRSCPA
jgi:hypothetical protein